MPDVSIIIPTHNRPHLLPRAVESAQRAGRDVEVILVDDASTDATAKVARSLHGIRYIRLEHNEGVAGARNLGILASRADYIAFLDDDDVRLPGSLELQVAALESAPDAGLVYGQAIAMDQSGNPTEDVYPKRLPQGDVFRQLLEQNFIPCSTVMFRRDCLFRAGLLDASVPGVEDWDLWVRISALYPVVALAEPLVLWRKYTPASAQYSAHADRMVRMSTFCFRRKWSKLNRLCDASVRVRREAEAAFSLNMAKHLVYETGRALASRRVTQARKNATLALRLHPRGVARAAFSYGSLKFLLRSVKGKMSRAPRGAHFISGQPDESKQ